MPGPTGPIGPTGPAGTGFPERQTRIVGLSWRHNTVIGPNLFQVDRPNRPPDAPRTGFVVAFGTELTNDPGQLTPVRFGSGSAEDSTVEMFFLELLNQGVALSELYARIPRRSGDLVLSELIPVTIRAIDNTGLVQAAVETAPAGGSPVTGVAIVWSERLVGIMRERFSNRSRDNRLFFQVRGDFVLDAAGRPIDANHVAGALPTGDRVPGGTFWSWMQL